jgi:hypothetical protein
MVMAPCCGRCCIPISLPQHYVSHPKVLVTGEGYCDCHWQSSCEENGQTAEGSTVKMLVQQSISAWGRCGGIGVWDFFLWLQEQLTFPALCAEHQCSVYHSAEASYVGSGIPGFPVQCFATLWLRQLHTVLPRWRHKLNRRPAYVGFMVHKEALEQVFSISTLDFPCQYHSTNAPYSFIYLLPTLCDLIA